MMHVIDSIMGSGKTTFMIQLMNSTPEQRFIYVTPNLSEVDRIITACPKLQFIQPSDEISKTAS